MNLILFIRYECDVSNDTASSGAQENPTNTAKQAQAALYIEASVRKEVDLALRTFLRCEACQAIAFQVLLEFSIAEQRSGVKHGELQDKHMAMALDEYGACTPSNFEEHRMYELNGTRYLGGSVRTPAHTSLAYDWPVEGFTQWTHLILAADRPMLDVCVTACRE